MKNILAICQDVAGLVATQPPQDLFLQTSQQEAVFLSLVKDTLDSLLRYGDWPELTKECSFITRHGRYHYPLEEICPDFFCLMNNTVYIKDRAEKVVGSITPEQWMREKYLCCPSLNLKFKIERGQIRFLTPPPDGLTIVFQYRANTTALEGGKNFIGQEKPVVSKNTDIPVFDEFLVRKGLIWRWLKRNGMDYTEEYDEYTKALRRHLATDMAIGDICLASGFCDNPVGEVIINAATKH